MKLWIALISVVLMLAACSPYPRESKRMAAAFETAQQVYGEGENDTLLFIPELDKASTYYARKKDYKKAALTALYQGYAEKDYDHTLAMDAFKEAERYAELIGDSLTIARAEYQMGRLLINDYMHDDALDMLGKSNANFGCHYAEKALALNGSACSYMLLGAYDRADSCLSLALHYAELCGSADARNKVLNNYAVSYQIQGEYNKAINYLRNVKPTNEQQMLLNMLNLGNYYLTIGILDSAAYYLQQLEEDLLLIEVKDETKVTAFLSLSWLAEKQGDFETALQYYKRYDELQYQIQERLRYVNVYRAQKKYDYEAVEKELVSEKIRHWGLLFVFVSVLFVAVVVILVMVFRQKQIKLEKVKIETELNKVKQAMLQFPSISKIEDELSWRLQLILKMQQTEERNLSSKAKQEMLKKYIMSGETTLYNAALSAILECYPKLQTTLQHRYPNLNETELRVCMLSVKGLSNREIAEILGVTIYTVNKCRSSIYKKMGVEADDFRANMSKLKTPF